MHVTEPVRPEKAPDAKLKVAIALFALAALCLAMAWFLLSSEDMMVASNASEATIEQADGSTDGAGTMLSDTESDAAPTLQEAIEPAWWTLDGAWSDASRALAPNVIGLSDVDDGEDMLARMPDRLLSELQEAGCSVNISSHPLAGPLAASDGEGDADGNEYACPSIHGDVLDAQIWIDGSSAGGFAHGMGHACYVAMAPYFNGALTDVLADIEARAAAGLPGAEQLSAGIEAAGEVGAEPFAVIFERFTSDEASLLAASPSAWEMMARTFGSHLISNVDFDEIHANAEKRGVALPNM